MSSAAGERGRLLPSSRWEQLFSTRTVRSSAENARRDAAHALTLVAIDSTRASSRSVTHSSSPLLFSLFSLSISHTRRIVALVLVLTVFAIIMGTVAVANVVLFKPMRYRCSNFIFALGMKLRRCSPRGFGSSRMFPCIVITSALAVWLLFFIDFFQAFVLRYLLRGSHWGISSTGVCSHAWETELQSFSREALEHSVFNDQEVLEEFLQGILGNVEKSVVPSAQGQTPTPTLICVVAKSSGIVEYASIYAIISGVGFALWTISAWRSNGIKSWNAHGMRTLIIPAALLLAPPFLQMGSAMTSHPGEWHPCRDCGGSDELLRACSSCFSDALQVRASILSAHPRSYCIPHFSLCDLLRLLSAVRLQHLHGGRRSLSIPLERRLCDGHRLSL